MNQQSVNKGWKNASDIIGKTIKTTLRGVEQEVASRTFRASNELRNASQYVLRGQRSGRRYKIPGTYRRQRDTSSGKMVNGKYYTASAPGEAPAVRTGIFRLSWGTHIRVERQGDKFKAIAAIESNVRVGGRYLLGEILEEGTPRMKPRPYKQATRDRAEPKIKIIYQKPYRV
jgi:hypothetical protein